jgi:hypothetical protein
MKQSLCIQKFDKLDLQNLITLANEAREEIKRYKEQIRFLSGEALKIDAFTKSSYELLLLLNKFNAIRFQSLEIIELIEFLSKIKNEIEARNILKNSKHE